MCSCNEAKMENKAADVRGGGLGMADRPSPKNILLNKLEDIGELRQKLNELEMVLGDLSCVPGRLADKLRPLLPIKNEGVAKGIPATPSNTEIGQRVQASIDHIREITGHLYSIMTDAQI